MPKAEVVWSAVLRRLPDASAKAAAMLNEPAELPRYFVIETVGRQSVAYDADYPAHELYSGPLTGRKVENLIWAVYFTNGWHSLRIKHGNLTDRLAICEAVREDAQLMNRPVEQIRAELAATDWVLD